MNTSLVKKIIFSQKRRIFYCFTGHLKTNLFPCRKLESEFPGAFGWAGEINVFKHALASNGFFHQNRVTERMLHNGDLDYLFNVLSDRERSSWQHKVELAS